MTDDQIKRQTPDIPDPPADDQRLLISFSPLYGMDKAGELIATIQRLSVARSMPEIQRIVSSAARRLTGADGATFALRDHGQCYFAEEDAISPLWKGQRFPLELCISGWTMLNRRSAVIEDVYKDDRVPHDAYRPTFVQSLATVPIRQLDPLGAIGSYWATSHQATEREMQLLQALADSTAVAIENVQAYQSLTDAHSETLERLALAAEYRDDDTYQHTERVAQIAGALAERLRLPKRDVALLEQAAPLHDLGKLAVPDAILLKHGRLSSRERVQIRKHPVAGAAILAGSRSAVLRLAEKIALTHHEWWDGSGYPAGLEGNAIPMAGRVVALADVFDALTHARPYKGAWSIDRARTEIIGLSGRQFDPDVIAAFAALALGDLADLVALQSPPGGHSPAATYSPTAAHPPTATG
jgi:putative nucleotidyltransferase with HDIG domain